MQPWISLANVIGGLLVMAAAVTDLAAARARARKDRRRRYQGSSPVKAITARYHAHHHTDGGPSRQADAHLWQHHR